MNPKLLYTISGYLSLLIGILATSCIYKMQLMFYGIMLAILGFIFSGVNIFLNQKWGFEEGKFPKGYLGMFLSSLPVLFMLMMIIKAKSN